MAFIDSHCHLDFPVLQENFDAVLALAKAHQITAFVTPSVGVDNMSRVQQLAEQLPQVHPAYGLHPCFMAQHNVQDVAFLQRFVSQHRTVAIGEIGLDFFVATTDSLKQAQVELFEQQLQLAQALQLPVILHVRKAHDQVLQLLKKHKFLGGGTVHAFNGSIDQAIRYTQEFNFKLGFGGTLTYPGSKKIRRLAAQLSLSSIVLETDAPDMPLANMQGDYNQPANIEYIAQVLCGLREESAVQVERQIELNTRQCFDL